MLTVKNFKKIERTHTCRVCGEEKHYYGFVLVEKFGYVCYDCANRKDFYYQDNFIYKGKKTRRDITFSIEFETDYSDTKQLILHKWGFIPTYDSSINGTEWKSPIYRNRKCFWYACQELSKLSHLVNSHCGTHCHVGIDEDVKYYLEHNSSRIFRDLTTIVECEPHVTEDIWGRYFNSYCHSDFDGSRYSWINPYSSHPTLEFRLPKFRDTLQYYTIVSFCIDVTKTIESLYYRNEKDRISDKLVEIYYEFKRRENKCVG